MAKSSQPVVIEYEGGERVTARPKMRHLIAAEEKFGKGPGGTPPIKGTLFAAWLSLDKPLGAFSTWYNQVDSIVVMENDDDDDDERPTTAAASDED